MRENDLHVIRNVVKRVHEYGGVGPLDKLPIRDNLSRAIFVHPESKFMYFID
jgi:hypothetical protein